MVGTENKNINENWWKLRLDVTPLYLIGNISGEINVEENMIQIKWGIWALAMGGAQPNQDNAPNWKKMCDHCHVIGKPTRNFDSQSYTYFELNYVACQFPCSN